jgi:hypothetical protein
MNVPKLGLPYLLKRIFAEKRAEKVCLQGDDNGSVLRTKAN